MSSDIIIRKAALPDADPMSVVEASVTRYPWSSRLFSDSLASHQCWLLEVDGRLAGALIYQALLDEVELLNIFVGHEFQGRGLGQRLMEFLIEQNRSQAARLFLEVRASNSVAISLYEKLGFKVVNRRKSYYPAESGREDALIMVFTYDG